MTIPANLIAPAMGLGGPQIALVDAKTNPASSAFNFGPAHPTRLLVAHVALHNGDSGSVLTDNITIGGIPATIVVGRALSGIYCPNVLAVAQVPAGTSGTIAFGYSGGIDATSVMLWSVLYAASPTPVFTGIDTDFSNGASAAVSTPGCAAIAAALKWGGTAPGAWSAPFVEDARLSPQGYAVGAHATVNGPTAATIATAASGYNSDTVLVAAWR